MEAFDPTEIAIRNSLDVQRVLQNTLLDANAARPKNTIKNYASKQREWINWCAARAFQDGSIVTEGKLVLYLNDVIEARGNRTGAEGMAGKLSIEGMKGPPSSQTSDCSRLGLNRKEHECRLFVNDSGSKEPTPSDRVPSKHGGVCTVIHRDLLGSDSAIHLVVHDIPDRYIVVRLNWHGRDVYLHNVYAPAKTSQQAQFFRSLPTDFATNALHIVGGDFNAVLDPALDSVRCTVDQISGIQELNLWLSGLELIDPWRLHHGDARVYSSPHLKNRLDYVLVSPTLNDQYYRDSKYVDEVHGGDHLAVQLRLNSSTAVQRIGPWRLQQPTLELAGVQDWLVEEMDGVLQILDKERNPAEELEAATEAVAKAKAAHADFLKAQSFHRDFTESEASTSFFFRPVTTTLSRCPIDRVRLANGEVTTCQNRVQDEHQRYWGAIFGDKSYASVSDVAIDETAQAQLLATIETTLPATTRDQIDAEVTSEEIATAIRKLPRGKAPGYDGLTGEFYRVDPDRMSRILKTVFDYQLQRRELLPDQRTSLVALLYKGKDRDMPSNYRPISLIPVDVKILSSVLTARLRSVISDLVHRDQRGFISGRSISHSLLLMFDLHDFVTKNDDTAFATFVDAEKAFDRVNWGYMWNVLTAMGFGATFISWCKLLYHNTTVRLNINGWLQDPICPSRGVKQGDPLSALLFVLTMEPLANLIRSRPDLGYQPQGMHSSITGSYFADDTVLVSRSADAVAQQLDLVQVYCAVSGAKLNISKTSIVNLNRNAPRIAHLQLRFLQTDENCRYLGLPFGQSITNAHRISTVNERFFAALSRWRWRARTFRGRKLLAQALILSQLWYATAVTYIPTNGDQDMATRG